MESNSNWLKWSKFVLKELERLSNGVEDLNDKINCKVHAERMSNLNNRLNWLYAFVTTVLVGGVALGVWMKVVLASRIISVVP